ncbi:hypothetical protein LCGC14_0729500 [marine sediment metagenome]|uniref:Uncharacterized protein n=1 Tax=marine sediment metagenome TaxID=412755 RepID=A0A0F9TH90_9ZZZZ
MTKEEILERIIANEISASEINTILYNALLVISWIELIALETDELFYLQIKPILDEFRMGNEKARKGLALTDLLAREGIQQSKGLTEMKAKKDNIVQFPPWGIKMK